MTKALSRREILYCAGGLLTTATLRAQAPASAISPIMTRLSTFMSTAAAAPGERRGSRGAHEGAQPGHDGLGGRRRSGLVSCGGQEPTCAIEISRRFKAFVILLFPSRSIL